MEKMVFIKSGCKKSLLFYIYLNTLYYIIDL